MLASSLRDMELFPLIVEGLRSKGMGHMLIVAPASCLKRMYRS